MVYFSAYAEITRLLNAEIRLHLQQRYEVVQQCSIYGGVLGLQA